MIKMTSCSQNKKTEVKIVSDFCQLHEPLNTELPADVLDYWQQKTMAISTKKKSGLVFTAEEKFVEVMINYAGANDKKYYAKKCDQL